MDTATRARTIGEQVGAQLRPLQIVVEDVVIRPAGKRRLVRLALARDVTDLLRADVSSDEAARPVPPLSLDEVADASRVVDEYLEGAGSELMGASPYTLEVSSLGVDAPLSSPARLRRNVGRLLSVDDGEGTRRARLLRAGSGQVVLDDAPQDALPMDQIASATVEIEFTRTTDGEDD